MAFEKGKSGNPGGRPKEKPFADALRMELAAAGDDHKKLRRIAKSLLDKAESGDMQAINAVADRLDGKPVQESEVTSHRVSVTEMSDDELERIAKGGEGTTAPAPSTSRPNSVH